MTRNKEAVLSEKDLSCHLGQTCLVGYSEPIDPSSFASFEEFMAGIQSEWDTQWKRVYSAKLSGNSQGKALHTHIITPISLLSNASSLTHFPYQRKD